ncbi:MAG: hypothetical protein QM270_08610 [Bacillota bacterium]|nr:hypothetical protein [Bacillota bacterium]
MKHLDELSGRLGMSPLTGRYRRLWSRAPRQLPLPPVSDFEAIRLLIDPDGSRMPGITALYERALADPETRGLLAFLVWALFAEERCWREEAYDIDLDAPAWGRDLGAPALLVLIAGMAGPGGSYASSLGRPIPDEIRRLPLGWLGEEIGRFYRTEGRLGVANFGWQVVTASMTLLRVGSHNFNLGSWSNDCEVWRSRSTGRALVLPCPGLRFAPTGVRLRDDEAAGGSFRSERNRDGHLLHTHRLFSSGFADPEPVTIDTRDWEREIGAGDTTLAFHIPRDDRYEPAHVKADFRAALAAYATWFPELEIRAIDCYSWLFSPLLGLFFDARESRIVAMQQECYLLAPTAGDESWRTFVFDDHTGDLRRAPRDNRLRRRALDWLDQGGCLYDGQMVLPVADIDRNRPFADLYEIEQVRDRHLEAGLDPRRPL